MAFTWFTRFLISAICILPLLAGVMLRGQTPLTADRIAVVDANSEIRLQWRMDSAERALQAGLSGVSETIYRSMLDSSSDMPPEQMAVLKLGLAQSLIGQRRFEAARAQLEAVSAEFQGPAFWLYSALTIYGDGGERVDVDAFSGAVSKVSEAGLSRKDLPWYAMAQGLVFELAGDAAGATAAYQRAEESTDQDSLRSHFESLILRQKLLAAPADEALAAELRSKINKFEGQSAAYPFVREYAVVLYNLGRLGEAVGAIERELENISADYGAGEREQLRLLKGIIVGADSESGRAALKALIREGRNREAMGIALQLLARTPNQDADLLDFLKVMISRTQPHPLLGQMYYLRSQLMMKDPDNPDMMAIAERDARILLEQFPGLSEITNVYRLLAFAATKREPPQYRAAADFLIQLRDQSRDPKELVELNRLIGDCYFLNRDFANAVDFYTAARSRELASNREGGLFLRLTSAQVRAGMIDEALQLIDEADFSGSIDLAGRWRAEWNIAQALQAQGASARALQRVRLLLADSSPDTVPTALDIRLRWLEAYLSLEAREFEGLADRLANLLARLNSMPPQDAAVVPDALTPEEARLLKTEILLLQGSVIIRNGDANAGMAVLIQLRQEFADTAAAQRSYLIEAAYHGLVEDFVSAQATLTTLAQSYPESTLVPQALFEAALYCERRGAEFYPQAVVLHNNLAERYASDPLFYFARLKQGNLLRSMNEFADAQIVYENLINGFPSHEMRYVAELSRADCMLALAGNEPTDLADVVVILERLLDLPNLPLDFQAEAAHKWGFALVKSGSLAKAKEVFALTVSRFLLAGQQAVELGASGRYWVARSMLQLGEIYEKDNAPAEARRIYRQLIAYDLPGRYIAISRADRLLNIE